MGSHDDLVVYADWLEERQLTWTLRSDPEAFELSTCHGNGNGYGYGYGYSYGYGYGYGYGYKNGNGHGDGDGYIYSDGHGNGRSNDGGAKLSIEAWCVRIDDGKGG